MYVIVILRAALPGHGGVPGGRGGQWEAATGGDSPGPRGGHAERPAPPGPGELPGGPAGGPTQGKRLFTLSTPHHICLLQLSPSAWYVFHALRRLISSSAQKTLRQLTVDDEENWILQLKWKTRGPECCVSTKSIIFEPTALIPCHVFFPLI